MELLPALREVVDGDVMRRADVTTYSRLLRIEVVRVANVNKHQVLKDHATENKKLNLALIDSCKQQV